MSKPLKNFIDPWYKNGLRFKCTGCGKCCTGSGLVTLTLDEADKISAWLKISIEKFLNIYCKKINGNYYLKDLAGTDHCIFLENKQCKIYPLRPTQCKTFPYWPSLLRTKEDWDREASYCEGINHPEGELVFPNKL